MVAGAPGLPVVDGVGRIPGFVNSYTFQLGDETILIDTGLSRKAKKSVRALRDANVPLERVQRVLLTHYHPDHMGDAAFLLENSRAALSVHGDDAAYVDGRAKPPMSFLMRLLVRTHPAPIATLLKDGDRIGPLVVVHAPGHTRGEVAFYEPERKLLFSGDSVVEHKGHLTLPGRKYADNLEQAVRSLDRLRKLDVEVLLPGHGVPVTKDIPSLLDNLIARAPAAFLGRPSS
jgi:glyoxylase-like metal-dependent hydrolase (beta-lactamase superfamily II)